jgi:hypothetical protein
LLLFNKGMIEDIIQGMVDLSIVGHPPITEGLDDTVESNLDIIGKVQSACRDKVTGVRGLTLRSMSAAWSSLLVGSMTAPGAGFSVVCWGAVGRDIIRLVWIGRIREKRESWGEKRNHPPNLLSPRTMRA